MPLALTGSASLDPMGDVEVVNVLLDDVIAAEPDKVVPVAHLVFHFGLLRLAPLHPHAVAVPIDAHGGDVADRAVLKPLDGFEIAGIVMPLQADADFQVLLLRFFRGFQNAANAVGVGRDRLFHEHVLVGLDRGVEMDRAEAGRSCDDDHVDAGIDRFLISVEADESLVFRHVDAISVSFFQMIVTAFEPILERVGHGDQLHRASRSAEGLRTSFGASPAAADQRDLDRFIAGGMGRSGDAKRAGQRAAGGDHGRRFQKIPAHGAAGRIGRAIRGVAVHLEFSRA